MQAGDELPVRRFRVTLAELVRYAGASGDFNPIHWNRRSAREVGLPDVIAHGMYTMALAGRYVTEWADDPAALVSFDARFSAPVVVPDDDQGVFVEVAGRIADPDGPEGAVVELRVTCGGAEVLRQARAVVRVRR